MKLYTFDQAPNARRLQLFLDYKGLAIDTEQVDLLSQAQLTDEYRAIVPSGTVPALVLDDGTVLTEVIGQCVYLEALHPDKPLLGTTPLEKAQVASWGHTIYTGLLNAVASMLRNRGKAFENRGLPGPLDLPQIPALVERGKLQVDYLLPEMDRHLADRDWVASDALTMADIDLLVACDFLGWVKESIPPGCTHLQAWYDRTQAALT
jgi:glutathione S-transferase